MILSKGSSGDAVRALQEMLNFLHYQGRRSSATSAAYGLLEVDSVFGANTEDAVLMFQEDVGLYTDGRVGPITLAALEKFYGTKQIELTAPTLVAGDGHYEVVSGPADVYGEGYGRVRLRSDVMAAFRSVSDEVHRQGGLLTSSGGIRALSADVSANRSATSLHYSGRAHDLYIWGGMTDPDRDPYVVQRLGDRRYRVYARCRATRAAEGSLPASTTIDQIVTYQSRTKGISVTDHFVDLTALFESNGFRPIRARQGFEPGKSGPLGAEWWHFQWEAGLIAGVSTFGSELRKIYSEATLKSSAPWKYRDYVWQKEWF